MCPRDLNDSSRAEGAGGKSPSMHSAATMADSSEASSSSPAVLPKPEVPAEARNSHAAAGDKDERWVQVLPCCQPCASARTVPRQAGRRAACP